MKRSLLVLLAGLAVCVFALIFTGCWDKDATPAEKAAVVSENATDTYVALYDTYKRLEVMLTGNDLAKLKEDVAPVMNKTKKHLIAYNDLIIQWRESGGGKPMELVTNERLLNSLLAEVSSLLLEFY